MKARLIDKATAELLGRIALYEQMIAGLAARLDEQEGQIQELRRQVSRAVSPSQLVSEAKAAEMLNLSPQTLAKWRKSPRPAIPVVLREGIIRYRVEDIEKFIREGTRGPKAVPRAA
ncbi:MAG TPA: helix-turn-helix domain-containing protein [Blastocatellia bacterium]|jgi:hypothetical protein